VLSSTVPAHRARQISGGVPHFGTLAYCTWAQGVYRACAQNVSMFLISSYFEMPAFVEMVGQVLMSTVPARRMCQMSPMLPQFWFKLVLQDTSKGTVWTSLGACRRPLGADLVLIWMSSCILCSLRLHQLRVFPLLEFVSDLVFFCMT